MSRGGPHGCVIKLWAWARAFEKDITQTLAAMTARNGGKRIKNISISRRRVQLSISVSLTLSLSLSLQFSVSDSRLVLLPVMKTIQIQKMSFGAENSIRCRASFSQKMVVVEWLPCCPVTWWSGVQSQLPPISFFLPITCYFNFVWWKSAQREKWAWKTIPLQLGLRKAYLSVA